MMLSEMLNRAIWSHKLKIRLLEDVTVKQQYEDDIVLPAGTISEIAFQNDDGTYHFEALNTACTVHAKEVEVVAR